MYVEDIAVKKQGYAILMAFILIFALTGCGNKSLLSAKEPVELTMWHVYGEQAGSPMDTLVEEFNRTEGKEKGVRVKVTELSSAAKIGDFLLEAQGEGPSGSLYLPHWGRHRPGRGQAAGLE